MKTAVTTLVLAAVIAAILADLDVEQRGPGRAAKACPACDRRRVPVCAADGAGYNRTFFNRCSIDYFNCEEDADYTFQTEGECPDDPLVWQYDENEALGPVEQMVD